jgi:hypothetical protein
MLAGHLYVPNFINTSPPNRIAQRYLSWNVLGRFSVRIPTETEVIRGFYKNFQVISRIMLRLLLSKAFPIRHSSFILLLDALYSRYWPRRKKHPPPPNFQNETKSFVCLFCLPLFHSFSFHENFKQHLEPYICAYEQTPNKWISRHKQSALTHVCVSETTAIRLAMQTTVTVCWTIC